MKKKIGKKVIYYDELTSTNEMAGQLLREGKLEEGDVIRAGFQTKGKGHAGNHWESDKDKNLLITTLIRPPHFAAEQQFLLSMAVSLAVCDFLYPFCDEVRIKWPNDIYAGDDKIAGLLLEHSLQGGLLRDSLWGIGININQEEFVSNAPNPISLVQLTGNAQKIDKLLDDLLEKLNLWYDILLEGDFQNIRNRYHDRLYGKDEWRPFRYQEKIILGRITGVSDQGILSLDQKEGEPLQLGFKEVEYIPIRS